MTYNSGFGVEIYLSHDLYTRVSLPGRRERINYRPETYPFH